MKDSEILYPVRVALHEFEEAVKKHEHRSLTEGELVRRQEVDRARNRLIDVISHLVHKDAERAFDAFWDSAPDLLCVSSKTAFVRVNKAFPNKLGWAKDEIEGKPFRDFIHPDDANGVATAVEQLESDSLTEFVNRLRTKDGRYAKVEWSAPVWDRAGLTYSIGRILEIQDA